MAGYVYDHSFRRSSAEAGNAYRGLAYRLGENVVDPESGKLHKFPRKDVITSGIALDPKHDGDSSMDYARNLTTLGFLMQHGDKGPNPKIARDFVALFPWKHGFSKEQVGEIGASFAEKLAKKYSVAVPYGIHEAEQGRALHDHGHFFPTVRTVGPNGLGHKARFELSREERLARGLEGSSRREIREINMEWADHLAASYEKYGIEPPKSIRGALQKTAGVKQSLLSLMDRVKGMAGALKDQTRASGSLLKSAEKVAGKKDRGAPVKTEERKDLVQKTRAHDEKLTRVARLFSKGLKALGVDSDAKVDSGARPARLDRSVYEELRAEKAAHAGEARRRLDKLSELTDWESSRERGRTERIQEQEALIDRPGLVASRTMKTLMTNIKAGKRGDSVDAAKIIKTTREQLAAQAAEKQALKETDRGL